jgi:hypothetical protein
MYVYIEATSVSFIKVLCVYVCVCVHVCVFQFVLDQGHAGTHTHANTHTQETPVAWPFSMNCSL